MSVFRIQRRKVQTDSRHKVYSQESKSYSQHSKKIAQILSSAQQHKKSNLQIKKRIFTHQAKEEESIDKFKRISEAYNISLTKRQNSKNLRHSKKSFSGQKVVPILQTKKNLGQKGYFSNGIARSSPRLEGKLQGYGKLSNTNKSNQFLQKRKKQFMSLNSSFYSKTSNTNTNSNRIISNRVVSKQRTQQIQHNFIQAIKQYKNKNTQKCLILLKQVLKYQPQNQDCLYCMGSCYLNLNQNQKSLKYLNQLKNLNASYNSNIYLYMAIIYKMLKNDNEAIKIMQDCLKIFPKFEQGFFYLGKLQMKQQKYQRAIKTFEKCMQLNQSNLLGIFKYILSQDIFRRLLQTYFEIIKSILNQSKVNQNILDEKSIISTHLKLIKILISNEQYSDTQLKVSISRLQQLKQQNPEFIFYKSFWKHKFQNLSSDDLSEIKVNLNLTLNYSNAYSINLDITKLLLKIYLDSKDMYQAEELLKRNSTNQFKQQHMKEWKLLIEGANDIIKRKNQEGKAKLQQCLKLTLKKQKESKNKKRISRTSFSNVDVLYIKLFLFQYLAYTNFIDQKYEQSLKVYTDLCSQQFLMFRKKNPGKFIQIQACKTEVEAVIQHRNKQNFMKAKQLLEILIKTRETPQIIFIWIINQISILKSIQKAKQQGQFDDKYKKINFSWNVVVQNIIKAEQISPKYSLIYFYHSLVNLYLQNYYEALDKVHKAIENVQEPVSQYHFIEALCYYLISQEFNDKSYGKKGLQALDKAIQMDSSIPEFYKQRSKHLFCLSKYQQAINDCKACQTQGQEQDQQAKLLSMFYYYVSSNYQKSQQLLIQLLKKSNSKSQLLQQQQDIDHKYKQFQQALMFRLRKYQNVGILKQLFYSLVPIVKHENQNENERQENHEIKKLDKKYISLLEEMIQNRNQYSQFTVYFINLVLAAYSSYQKDYASSLNYLFSCLEEIQCIVDEKSKNYEQSSDSDSEYNRLDRKLKKSSFKNQFSQIDTDSMLNEIKYNIVIATLLKNHQELIKEYPNLAEKRQMTNFPSHDCSLVSDIYNQTLTFISTFIRESQSEQLIENLRIIKKLIQQSQIIPSQDPQKQEEKIKRSKPKNDIRMVLKPFLEVQKFSDFFPNLNVPIGHKYNLVTKFLVFYPMKLKFNIRPQFDPAFLFNFDIDKIENKLIPPWFKFAQKSSKNKCKNRLIFTDQLRNQSIAISETQRQSSVFEKNRRSRNRYETQHIQESEQKLETNSNKAMNKIKDLKNIVKLDSMIQKKLKRLFPQQ